MEKPVINPAWEAAPVRRRRRARKRLLRRAVRATAALFAGAAIGAVCKVLPHDYQAVCHLAAKLTSLLGKFLGA